MGIKKFLNQLLEPEPPTREMPVVAAAADTKDASGQGADPLLVQALAGTLRAVGEGAFDMDESDGESIRARFEELARHVEAADAERLATLPENVSAHRRRERHWVTKIVRDMAETVVSLMTRLGRNVTLDRSTDQRVEGQLQRLRGAVAHDNMAMVRLEVLSAAETISGALKERDERQRTEMAAISRQLESLKSELTHTRREMALDGLTRLYNRASLDEQMQSVASIAVLSGRDACLLMVDVDHFKNVNDTWGHQAGDAVLKAVSDVLVKSFPRRSDFVGRFGGEEFAVILGEDGGTTGAMLATRLLERVRQIVVPWEQDEIRVTMSVGVAGFHEREAAPEWVAREANFQGDETVKEWIARADKALYEAKGAGRDRVVEG